MQEGKRLLATDSKRRGSVEVPLLLYDMGVPLLVYRAWAPEPNCRTSRRSRRKSTINDGQKIARVATFPFPLAGVSDRLGSRRVGVQKME